MYNETAIFIPARIGSTRLPGKLHKPLFGKTILQHSIDRAKETGIKDIFVAVDNELYMNLVYESGAHPIMTDPEIQTGSDRIYFALQQIEKNEKFKFIINYQADAPFIRYNSVIKCLDDLMNDPEADIGTLATTIKDKRLAADPNVVKIALGAHQKALYFSRSLIPNGAEQFLYHIGLYIYKRHALEKFMKLPQSPLELTEKLEQLRALENGLKIRVTETNELPVTIDTQQDLEKAEIYAKYFFDNKSSS